MTGHRRYERRCTFKVGDFIEYSGKMGEILSILVHEGYQHRRYLFINVRKGGATSTLDPVLNLSLLPRTNTIETIGLLAVSGRHQYIVPVTIGDHQNTLFSLGTPAAPGTHMLHVAWQPQFL